MGGSQECSNCGAYKYIVVCSARSFCVCIIWFPATNFLDYTKQVLTPEAFAAFNHSSIFDKAVFYLGEKQGMLVNNEFPSWYNRVENF